MTPAELRALLALGPKLPLWLGGPDGSIHAESGRVLTYDRQEVGELAIAAVNALPALLDVAEAARIAVDVNEVTAGLCAALAKLGSK